MEDLRWLACVFNSIILHSLKALQQTEALSPKKMTQKKEKLHENSLT